MSADVVVDLRAVTDTEAERAARTDDEPNLMSAYSWALFDFRHRRGLPEYIDEPDLWRAARVRVAARAEGLTPTAAWRRVLDNDMQACVGVAADGAEEIS
ncbi:hypothetical protein ACG83_10915 [Frankia sp. R43]|nr:hypothetical protein ACG83_10915 [Frankia sp. R43]